MAKSVQMDLDLTSQAQPGGHITLTSASRTNNTITLTDGTTTVTLSGLDSSFILLLHQELVGFLRNINELFPQT